MSDTGPSPASHAGVEERAEHLAILIAELASALRPRYLVGQVLGQGASAVVLLAEDMRHHRHVAIKVLRPDVSPIVGRERFLQEIEIAARLQHPHILPLFDSGAVGELLYFVMPHIPGENLRGLLDREGQLPLRDATRVTSEIAAALSFAHRQGVLHRDVKPENILISDGRMLVADFGIARMLQAELSTGQTVPGLVFGTPGYMSPEQVAGGRLEASADQYSLACIVYEMLSGKPIFTGSSPRDVMSQHLVKPHEPLRSIRPDLPAGVEAVVHRALSKVPDDRYESVDEFARALHAAARPSQVVAAPTLATRGWRIPAVLFAGLAAVTLASWLFRSGVAEPLSRDRVAVFPLADPPSGGGQGAAAAAYLGYVLDGTDPLQWQDGRDWISSDAALSTGRMRELARQHDAAWFVDGTIVEAADSVTVIVRLHDAAGDSVVSRGGRTAVRGTSVPLLAARAMGDILPVLVQPGHPIDVAALRDRSPVAIAHFLKGDGYYRMAAFDSAQEQYEKALGADSTFALAALQGATAAAWRADIAGASHLAHTATDFAHVLSRRDAAFAEGLEFLYAGEADSALQRFDSLVAIAPGRPEGWMARGEVYYHLLPTVAHLGSLDSMARRSFEEAERLDTAFTPVLSHLTELALRRGDTAQAHRYLQRFRQRSRDSTGLKALATMWECATGEMDTGQWRQFAAGRPGLALDVARAMSSMDRLRACARDGYRAVLEDSLAPASLRFPAMLGLQGLMLLDGRPASEVEAFLQSPDARALRGDLLFLIDAHSRPEFDSAASAVARTIGQDYPKLPDRYLWLIGVWHARRGNRPGMDAVARAMEERPDSLPGTLLFKQVLRAHTAAAKGDTVAALAALDALSWSQRWETLSWAPMGGLGAERLLQARLLLARGDTAGALRACGTLDSRQPIAFLMYRNECTAITDRLMHGSLRKPQG